MSGEFLRGDQESVDATGHVEDLGLGREIDLTPLRTVIEEAMQQLIQHVRGLPRVAPPPPTRESTPGCAAGYSTERPGMLTESGVHRFVTASQLITFHAGRLPHCHLFRTRFGNLAKQSGDVVTQHNDLVAAFTIPEVPHAWWTVRGRASGISD